MKQTVLFLAFAAAVSGCGTSDDASPQRDSGQPAGDARGDAPADATAGSSSDAPSDVQGKASADASVDVGTTASGASVLQFHNDINRDGLYVDPVVTNGAATMHRDTTFD